MVHQKSKRKNVRRAGAKNELNLVKALNDWTGWEFHRTPASGGLRWGRDQRVGGDIVPPADHAMEFPFVIETKKRSEKKRKTKANKKYIRPVVELGLLVLDWSDCKLMDFWRQVMDDAVRTEKVPLLFLRNDGMAKGLYYVFMGNQLAEDFEQSGFAIDFMHIPALDISITNSFELFEQNHLELFKFVQSEWRSYVPA